LKFVIAQELLALGERIGNVNTGVSEDLISKCLRETIYCSSDQIQEEPTCVICLVRRIFTLFETGKYELGIQVGGSKSCGYQLGIVEIIRSVDAKYDTFYWFWSFSRDTF
jgi:hypothetical protein